MRFSSRRIAKLWIAFDARRFKVVQQQINTTVLDLNKTPLAARRSAGDAEASWRSPGSTDRPSADPPAHTRPAPSCAAGILDAWVTHRDDTGDVTTSHQLLLPLMLLSGSCSTVSVIS